MPETVTSTIDFRPLTRRDFDRYDAQIRAQFQALSAEIEVLRASVRQRDEYLAQVEGRLKALEAKPRRGRPRKIPDNPIAADLGSESSEF